MAQTISKMETIQTAVDWLVKELNLEGYDYTVQQAKAMEKEQIIKAFTKGELISDSYYDYQHPFNINGQNYYKETYES